MGSGDRTMSGLPVFTVSVIETYKRSVELRVHADNVDEAIEEALKAYVDTSGAIGNWGEKEKNGVAAVVVG